MLKDCEENYEHIAAHVDGLLIDAKHPQKVVDALVNKHHIQLKGTGPVSYRLGYDF